MAANVSEHGWAYGVHQGHGNPVVSDTLCDIIDNGRNLTQEAAEQDLRDRLKKQLEDFDCTDVSLDDNDELVRQLQEHVRDVFNNLGVINTARSETLDEGEQGLVCEAVDCYDNEDGWDANEVYNLLVDWLHGVCCDGFDESTYLHVFEERGERVEISASCLGGAYLLFVQDSPYLAACRVCSPCVPGAGDLDTPCSGVESTWDHWSDRWAYCLPPSWFTEADQPVPYQTVRTVSDGEAGDICYRKELEDA